MVRKLAVVVYLNQTIFYDTRPDIVTHTLCNPLGTACDHKFTDFGELCIEGCGMRWRTEKAGSLSDPCTFGIVCPGLYVGLGLLDYLLYNA